MVRYMSGDTTDDRTSLLSCSSIKIECVLVGSPTFFIKEKSELQRFVLDYKVLIKVLFTTIMEQIGL